MAEHKIRSALTAGLATILLAAALVAASGGPAIGAEGSTVGIRPAGQNDWFRSAAAAGEVVEDTALISNKSSQAVPILVYPVDAIVTPQGDFALEGRDAPRRGVGAWARVPVAAHVLAPRSTLRVPFRIEIPKDAEPGDYSGGIVVELNARPGTAADVGNSLAVQFNVVERVGVRIFLRVTGAVVRRLELGGLTWTKTPKGIELVVGVRNTGTVSVTPSGSVRIHGWRADEAVLTLDAPEMVLPGASGTLKALWRDVPTLARASAQIKVEYGEPGSLTTSTHKWFIPWRLLMIGAGGLLLVLFVVARSVRFVRRARRALRLVDAAPSVDDVVPDGIEAALAVDGVPGGAEAVPASDVPSDEYWWMRMMFPDEIDEQEPRAS